MIVKAEEYPFHLLCENEASRVYPLLRSVDGNREMVSISPLHGRSYCVGKTTDGRYIISKGNGLSYTQWQFLWTKETEDDTWGLLLLQDALRDYHIGLEIEALGIRTNHMECVIEIEKNIMVPNTSRIIKPVLLQYNVACPYRLEDAQFIDRNTILDEVEKWQIFNLRNRRLNYLVAADVLINNLRIMHDHAILHNALTTHNYTWALELLDFELAHSPNYPYSNEDDRRHVKDLYDREVLDVYKIIIFIAGILREEVDNRLLDNIFDEYGFDIEQYKLL